MPRADIYSLGAVLYEMLVRELRGLRAPSSANESASTSAVAPP